MVLGGQLPGRVGHRRFRTERAPAEMHGPFLFETGGVLLSQEVALQVPSALTGLTSVFGMGTGLLVLAIERSKERTYIYKIRIQI